MKTQLAHISASAARVLPNRWDVVAFALIYGLFVLAAIGAHQMREPLATLELASISLDPHHLPEYALRTVLRMLAAMLASLIFTFTYATLAAKNRRAEMVLIPLLDILQSVPVLGFISFTIVFFLRLFPGNVLGAEFASIFAIFTSQAWNMAFSFYQSLRTVPADLEEVSRSYRFSGWQRFWRLEVPFSMPGLVWNAMMSMSGGWFFVVASEAITVGDRTVTLPGIGSYVAMAIEQRNMHAICWAILTMLLVILAYDQLLFRPLVAWSEKFRADQTDSNESSRSWVLSLLARARLLQRILLPVQMLMDRLLILRIPVKLPPLPKALPVPSAKITDGIWIAILVAGALFGAWMLAEYVLMHLSLADVMEAAGLGFITLLRVLVLIAIATLIWVPIGVWVGLHPRVAEKVQPLAQFLAAFPANLLFPVAVVMIVRHNLNPDIWLSPLIILGTQWYILFNVIAGASAFPNDLREVAANFHIHGLEWWRKVILPGIFPYYVTGAITASGGSWNASIVAEMASWGSTTVTAHGIGSYIAQATAHGDYPRIVLGISVMSVFVLLLNRLLWRKLYVFAEQRLRLG